MAAAHVTCRLDMMTTQEKLTLLGICVTALVGLLTVYFKFLWRRRPKMIVEAHKTTTRAPILVLGGAPPDEFDVIQVVAVNYGPGAVWVMGLWVEYEDGTVERETDDGSAGKLVSEGERYTHAMSIPGKGIRRFVVRGSRKEEWTCGQVKGLG